MTSKKFRVLIVGCGQLGSRHLQAVASLPMVEEIEVVDPNPSSLTLGQTRVQEVVDRNPNIRYRWATSIESAAKGGDLCIVATQAAGRCQMVRNVADRLGYKTFLLEKIVAQTIREYDELLDFSREKSLQVWINFKSRAHPSHKRIKAALVPGETFVFSVTGGNHGLANNGVHVTDLFVFFDESGRPLEPIGVEVDPALHSSKRGNTLYDLSGSLTAKTATGNRFNLVFAADSVAPVIFSITSKSYRAIADDTLQWMVESRASNGWGWESVPFKANMAVSQMSRVFVSDIFLNGSCELPTLEESYEAHRFILSSLTPTFNRLLNKEDDLCPVT